MCQACETSKKCNDCGLIKPLSSFPTAGKKADGWPKFHFICRDCKRIRDKKYDEEKRDKQKAREAGRRYCARPENKEARRQYQKARYIESNASQDITIIKCTECESTELIRRKSDRRECKRCYNHKQYLSRLSSRVCPQCNTNQVDRFKSLCKQCKDANDKANKKGQKCHIRRAKLHGVKYSYLVKQTKVFNRDKWSCKMCGCKVQKVDIYADNAAEIDHIVLISKGGPHTYSNVQTLCRRCNMSKGDRLVGQLVLSL